jgi:hypothetical protein
MAGGEPGETLAEAGDERLRLGLGRGVPRHGLHHRQQVLGAMVDLTQ